MSKAMCEEIGNNLHNACEKQKIKKLPAPEIISGGL
jgi:hypothetical protein